MSTLRTALEPLGIGIVAELTAIAITGIVSLGYWIATP